MNYLFDPDNWEWLTTGNNVRFIIEGFLINLEIALVSMVFALILGLALALLRLSSVKPVSVVAGAWIDLFRNLPLIFLNKDTTLVSIIAITEVMRRARIVTASNFFTVVEAPILHVFIFVGLLFVIVNYALSRLSRRLELRERERTGTKLRRVRGLE